MIIGCGWCGGYGLAMSQKSIHQAQSCVPLLPYCHTVLQSHCPTGVLSYCPMSYCFTVLQSTVECHRLTVILLCCTVLQSCCPMSFQSHCLTVMLSNSNVLPVTLSYGHAVQCPSTHTVLRSCCPMSFQSHCLTVMLLLFKLIEVLT